MSEVVNREGRDYRQIPIGELEHPESRRDIRQNVVEQIKDRINDSEYNPAKPMRVFDRGSHYDVADGNHRLKALKELDRPNSYTVPCTVEPDNADIVTVAIESNRDEDTFAEQDLFDYLDRIDSLRDSHTQAEIGDKLGWSESKVKNHSALLTKTVTEVLEKARSNQEGRVTSEVTNVTFNFTEGWFRNSGIYGLTDDFQKELMQWFVEEKNCSTSQSQVRNKAEKLQAKQEQLAILDEQLNAGVEQTERERLVDSIKAGEQTDNSLSEAIEKVNNEAKNQAHFGCDATEKLQDIPDNKVDIVVTDPPYGTDYTSHRDTDNPEFGTDIDDSLALLDNVFSELERVCKANSHIYLFFSMNRYEEVVKVAKRHFEVTETPLIWAKNNHVPTRDATSGFDKMYAHQYEPVLVCRMPNGKGRELNGGVCTNVLEHDVPKKDNRWHDSQKPISLAKELITNSTGAKATVLDPFAGSGSTLLAAKESDRHYIGIEANAEYESRFEKEVNKRDHE